MLLAIGEKKGLGHTTQKCGPLAHWVFQAEGLWEMAFAGRTVGVIFPEAGLWPTPGGKEHPHLLRGRALRGVNMPSQVPPGLLPFAHSLLSCHILPGLALTKPSIKKTLRFNSFLSLLGLPGHWKLLLSTFVCFSLVNVNLSVGIDP